MIQKQDLRYFQEKQILVASIDIGTNSTHLLVAEINVELKSFSIKFTDKSTTRLGERDEEGNLTEESIQRALGITVSDFVFPALGDMDGSGTVVYEINFGNPSFSISSGNSDANGYGNFEYSVPSGYFALNTKNLAEYG